MDLKQVHIQDYSIVPAEDGIHGFEKHEGDYLLDYNFNGTPAWTLTKDLVYDAAKKAMFREPSVRMRRSTPRSSMT